MLAGSYFSWQFIPKKWCCIGEWPSCICNLFYYWHIEEYWVCRSQICRVCLCIEIKSLRYLGARLFKHLNVNNNILKEILSFTGSQWSLISSGVLWSYFCFPVISFAVEFCRCWSLYSRVLGRPNNSELQ